MNKMVDNLDGQPIKNERAAALQHQHHLAAEIAAEGFDRLVHHGI